MHSHISELEDMINLVSSVASLPIGVLHRVVFCSLAKAGLALFGTSKSQMVELEGLVRTVPTPLKGLLGGRLYLCALNFINSINRFLREAKKPVIIEEANIHFVLDFLKKSVGRVDGVVVLDCGSVPEMVAIAGKFVGMRRSAVIYDKIFVNPVGTTAFLTEQLARFGREAALKYYAELLKSELKAAFCTKIPSIDIAVHRHGIDINSFIESLNMQRIFEQISYLARQRSVLITADHGYDLVADEHGLYLMHGYRGRCPLNFSRIALFLVVS